MESYGRVPTESNHTGGGTPSCAARYAPRLIEGDVRKLAWHNETPVLKKMFKHKLGRI